MTRQTSEFPEAAATLTWEGPSLKDGIYQNAVLLDGSFSINPEAATALDDQQLKLLALSSIGLYPPEIADVLQVEPDELVDCSFQTTRLMNAVALAGAVHRGFKIGVFEVTDTIPDFDPPLNAVQESILVHLIQNSSTFVIANRLNISETSVFMQAKKMFGKLPKGSLPAMVSVRHLQQKPPVLDD